MFETDLKLLFIRRYRYLFLHSKIIFADYLSTKGPGQDSESISNLPDILVFLLGNSPLEKTKLYQKLKLYKKQANFLDIVKNNFEILKETTQYNDENFSFWTILSLSRNYLIKNTNPSLKRRQALQVLDEYFRVLRHTNDGKKYHSGYYLEFEDIDNCHFRYLNPRCNERVEYQYRASSKEEPCSRFVYFFANTSYDGTPKQGYHFTDSEIEKIYLSLHDELPFNLFTECSFDETDTSFERPKNTRPCHFQFRISEANIFTDGVGHFYQLCPNCGYITLIDESLIPDPVQDRIIARCKMNPEIGKINYFTSEITNIEYRSHCPTRILTSNHILSTIPPETPSNKT